MAHDTPRAWRNLVIYEVYVRNHGPHGTFADLEADLPRIRSMGVDVMWLMPIHPIGAASRKGALGSPYAIADYRAVNPEYGTHADFAHLVEQAHRLGLQVMIDVVYNHTARDSVLVSEHPDWFHQDQNGVPVSTVLDWTDVIDLNHPNQDLADYLIECLRGWAKLGVDGFRCDVASLLPEGFWVRARHEVAQIRPQAIWLAESVHAAWVAARRFQRLPALSDSELYRAFDMTYDYDIWPIWQAAVVGKEPLRRYLTMVRYQDSIYPENYIKMRCVENHDQLRIMGLAPTRAQALAWTAFAAFNRGSFLIYAGQEAGASHTPSLFDTDTIEWGNYALQPFLTTLARIKKDRALMEGDFLLLDDEPVIQATWYCRSPGPADSHLYGVFNVTAESGNVAVRLPDGVYTDALEGAPVEVHYGRMAIPETAAILRYNTSDVELAPFYSVLLDFHLGAS